MRGRATEEGRCPACGFDYEEYLTKKNPTHLNPSSHLNHRYIVGRVLGAGGFGVTYLGYDETLHIVVAIKEYFPLRYAVRNTTQMREGTSTVYAMNEREFAHGRENFKNEARLLAQFNKERGIVSVMDQFSENNTEYMVMEYIPGLTLKKIVGMRREPMPENEVKELMEPVLNSLQKLHNYRRPDQGIDGIFHRDISPDNLVMNEEGELVLIDFGAARESSEEREMTVQLKPGYAPPEQYTKDARKQGPWSDIYALCATMYFMVTNAKPTDAQGRRPHDDLLSLADLGMDVSKEFSDAIKKGMSLNYQVRFQDIQELRDALWPKHMDRRMRTSIDDLDSAGVTQGVTWGTERWDSALHDASQKNVRYDHTANRGKKSGGTAWLVTGLAVLACLVVLVVGGYFVYAHLPGSAEKVSEEPAKETDLGTGVTIKSKDIERIPLYDAPGGSEKEDKIREAVCCQILEEKDYEGEVWYKIDYCGRGGWTPKHYVRYLSEDALYFSVEEGETETAFNTETKIKLHAGPYQDSAITDHDVPYGTEFAISELQDGWGRTVYEGKECWVDMNVTGAYLTKYWQVERCDDSKKKNKTIKLRRSWSADTEILAEVPVGTVVEVVEFKNGWGKVTYEGKTGWMMLHYMTSCGKDGLPSEDLGNL